MIDFAKQFHLQTATWGLSVWEEELGLTTSADTDLELRRSIVMAKLLGTAPMTVANTNKLINLFTENGTGYVIELPEPGVLRIVIPQQNVFYEELINALNEFLPSHLQFHIQFEMKLDWTGEDKIRIGMSNIIIGTKRIGLASPPDADINLAMLKIIRSGHGGKIGVDAREKSSAELKFASAMAIHGKITVPVNIDDVPLWMRSLNQPSRVATKIALRELTRRITRVKLSTAESIDFDLNQGMAEHNVGVNKIGANAFDEGRTKIFVGKINLRNGKRIIGADHNDLPPWMREDAPPQIAAVVGNKLQQKSIHKIGVDGREVNSIFFRTNTLNVHCGHAIIGADLDDLITINPIVKAKILSHTGLFHTGTMALG